MTLLLNCADEGAWTGDVCRECHGRRCRRYRRHYSHSAPRRGQVKHSDVCIKAEFSVHDRHPAQVSVPEVNPSFSILWLVIYPLQYTHMHTYAHIRWIIHTYTHARRIINTHKQTHTDMCSAEREVQRLFSEDLGRMLPSMLQSGVPAWLSTTQ